MKELEKRLAKVDSQIATAKVSKDKQKRRLKIVRSYKGDTSTGEAILKTTKDGITASESERKSLVTQLRGLEDEKE